MIDEVSSDSAVSSMGSSPPHNVRSVTFATFPLRLLLCYISMKNESMSNVLDGVLQDFNETGSMMSNISSPFEGLEGATGGSDYDSGSDKYSPKLLR